MCMYSLEAGIETRQAQAGELVIISPNPNHPHARELGVFQALDQAGDERHRASGAPDIVCIASGTHFQPTAMPKTKYPAIRSNLELITTVGLVFCQKIERDGHSMQDTFRLPNGELVPIGLFRGWRFMAGAAGTEHPEDRGPITVHDEELVPEREPCSWGRRAMVAISAILLAGANLLISPPF